MKVKSAKYNQLLFIYACLRQIDLSLDRSRWTSWNRLQVYFKDKLQPAQIIEYLVRNFQLPNTDFEQFIFIPEKRNFIRKLKSVIGKDQFLKQNEILYCCKLLWSFDKELKSNIKEYNLNIEKLRIDIAEYYSEVLSAMISNKDLKRLMKIEHYEQNEKIEVFEIKEFVPDDY